MCQPEKVWCELSEHSQFYRIKILAYIVGCDLMNKEPSIPEIARFFDDCNSCVLGVCTSLAMMELIEITPKQTIRIP